MPFNARLLMKSVTRATNASSIFRLNGGFVKCSRCDKEPQGFILTAILGIVGAFAATYLGQAIGWYGPAQNAGFIGAIVGAALILLVWGFIDRRRRV